MLYAKNSVNKTLDLDGFAGRKSRLSSGKKRERLSQLKNCKHKTYDSIQNVNLIPGKTNFDSSLQLIYKHKIFSISFKPKNNA